MRQEPDDLRWSSDVSLDGVRLRPEIEPGRRPRDYEPSFGLAGYRKPSWQLPGQVSEIKGIWEFVERSPHPRLERHCPNLCRALATTLKGRGKAAPGHEGGAWRPSTWPVTFVSSASGGQTPRDSVRRFDIVAVPSHVEPAWKRNPRSDGPRGDPVVGAGFGGIPEMVVDGENRPAGATKRRRGACRRAGQSGGRG